MHSSPYIVDITPENFQQVILEGSMRQPVLIDFWADWCAPCKALLPVLTKLTEEYNGQLILAKINIEEQPEIAAQFQVRSVPTVILVNQGQFIDQFTGAKPESEIRAFLKQHIRNPVEDFKVQIKQLLSEGQLDTAQTLLEQAMAQLPEDMDLKIDLARVYLQQNQSDAAQALLMALPDADQQRPEVKGLIAGLKFAEQAPSAEQLALLADREDSEALYLKALAAVVQADYEQAIDQLLQLLRTDRSYQEGVAHKTLLEVFTLLGEAHPLVIRSRRQLYTLMY